MKWRQAFYGLENVGWIVAVRSYTNYVSLTFFAGTKLKPVPPLGEHKSGRRVNLYDLRDVDETRLQSWFRQAAATKGWGTVR